ncbi:MAG: FtsX-like permease family protein [Spirochaetaceae bacterium]|jgi:ABC-type lipoprotein release transport system permease subunit|nr:FtsX-like permease family protein [Spirochaetaceae bacterium]
MMMASVIELTRLALRNLARHRVKTILTIAAVSISVGVYIIMDGWIMGMNIDSLRNIANFEIGAAKLQTKAYYDKKDELPMYENFGGWEQSAAALDEAGYDCAPRFVFTGTIYSETASAPMVFIGCDPVAEARVLHYPKYIESGRFIRKGAFELVLGAVTADKLKVGIPQRPTVDELEQDILPNLPAEKRDFVRGLYEKAPVKSGGLYAPQEAAPSRPGEERWVLKKNTLPQDMERYWKLLAEAGRMNVQISTVIDIKAAPESVRKEKFEVDLAPVLSSEEMELFHRMYQFDELTQAWYLDSGDETLEASVLAAMVRVDYAGAIRHVNQLISAVVVGVVNSPNPKTNNNTAWIPLDVLQDETGLMLEGRVTELLIRIKNADNTKVPGEDEGPEAIKAAMAEMAIAGAASTLPAALPEELDIFSWEGYVQDYIAAARGDNVSYQVIIVVLFILSFMGIANTMLLAILERTREAGMMRAMGMTDGQLIGIYMMEAGMVGFFGSLIGILLGCLINIPMVKYGLDFTAMTESMGGDIGYRLTGVFRSAWNIPVIIGSGIIAPILASCMAFFPTRRALKMPITESLRFE